MADDVPLPKQKATTRRDVARHAGVSVAVVSYTLNGKAPVAPATAERVRRAIQELGYIPNRAAVALKSGSTKALALVAPKASDPVFTNPFFAEFANEVESAAQRRGYALYTTSAAQDGADGVVERIQEFAARQVDGVLLLPGAKPIQPAVLDQLGIPWLELNTIHPQAGAGSVGVDLFSGAREATAHLIEHGYPTVAFVGELPPEEPRRLGWAQACREAGLRTDHVLQYPMTHQGGYQAGLELARQGRPRAIFVASDRMAVGVLRALHENAVKVPDEVAFVSFDGSWEGAYAWPSISSIRQPIELMAERSVARLVAPPPHTPVHESFHGTLILRDSCGPHPDSRTDPRTGP